MIEIHVNGEVCNIDAQNRLSDALQSWGYTCERVAVAIDGEFVARADYANTILRAGNVLDIVAPVQGG
jgi:sulfur carrier protein